MVTVGIAGFGLSGRYLQAPFFLKNPHFRLKSIASSQNVGTIYPSVQRVDALDDLLKDPEIELVSLGTPNETHFEYTTKSLKAGKHVLVEKPFTATAKQAEKLIDLAQKQGRHLFVFQNRRWDSDFLTVQKVVKNGLIGDIISYEAHFNRYKPVLNVKKWKEVASPSNGILYDLGSHILDQTIALFGKPKSVWGETFTQREGSDIDDAFDIKLDYGKLKVTLKSSLLVREDTPRYIIQGTKGSFVKYGIDQQEDHLKAGLMPDSPNFGAESVENWGTVNTEVAGLNVRGRVETEVGNWMPLFQNMHDVIVNGAASAIDLADIVEQIRIMALVKRNG
jgi:scyllo-inositol 2-dehydrogenase (NADP+)